MIGPERTEVTSAVGAAVLGVLTVSVLLAAESAVRETYGETVGAVALTMLSYWLGHSYAEFASARIRRGERLAARGLAREMLRELQLLTGAAVPLVTLLACWAAGATLDTGIKAAVLSGAVMIAVIETAAALRAHLRGRDLLIQTLIGVALGLLVLALRLALH